MASELLLTTYAQNTQQVSCSFWDHSNGNVLQVYKNGGNIAPKTLDILGNDYIVAAEKTKPLLHVWSMNNQEPLKTVRLILPEPANALSVSSRSTYLAAGINSKLYIWELCSGALLSVQQVNYQPITCVKFSNCSSFIVITGQDGMIVTYNLMDLINPQYRQRSQRELEKVDPLYRRLDHSLPINDLSMGKFSYKSRFATASSDQTLRIYQLLDGELLLTLIFDSVLTALCLDAPFHNLFVGDNQGNILRFDLTEPPRTLEHHVNDTSSLSFVGHKSKIVCIDINIYNNRLASGCEDNNVFVWELKSRQILRKIELKSQPTNLRFVLTSEHRFSQNYSPAVLLNTFERNVNSDPGEITISVLQNEDFCVRINSLKRKHEQEATAIQDLQAQLIGLKKLNKDLFFQLQKYKNSDS